MLDDNTFADTRLEGYCTMFDRFQEGRDSDYSIAKDQESFIIL